MDWSTALFTAAISAVVSVFVSLLAVATVTVKQERAKRRENARVALDAVVQPLIERLSRYRYSTGRTEAARDGGASLDLGDLSSVIAIRRAASPLRAWQRAAVDRRLRTIYGGWMVETAKDFPASNNTPDSAALGAFFGAALNAGNGAVDRLSPEHALITKTYSKPPSQAGGNALHKQLVKLAKAR